MERLRKHRGLVAALAGAIAGIGTLLPAWWMLAPLGLALFFWNTWKTERLEDALWGGMWFGWIASGISVLWLFEMLPPSAPLFSWAVLLATLFWLLPTVALGLMGAPFGWMLHRTRTSIFAPLVAVLVTVLFEEGRMWAWYLATWGPNAFPGPNFSMPALGYALAESPYLLQLAGYGGLLALTICTALIASALAYLVVTLSSGTYARAGMSVVFLSLVLLLPLGATPAPEESASTLQVAIFSTYSTSTPGASYDARALAASLEASAPPDVILLPEGRTLESIVRDGSAELMETWSEDKEVLTIRSEPTFDRLLDAHFNTLFYESSERGTLATHRKIYTMAHGEYLPYLTGLIASLVPSSGMPIVSERSEIAHGNDLAAFSWEGVRFGSLLCSEVVSPHLYRALVREHGANVLVNLANPDWFHGSHILYQKTQQIAKVHAVQNRAYSLSAQNSTSSYVIDPGGVGYDDRAPVLSSRASRLEGSLSFAEERGEYGRDGDP